MRCLNDKKYLLISIMIVLLLNCGCSKKIEVKENEDSRKVILKGKIVTMKLLLVLRRVVC
jgi:hypothetical protein